MKILVDEIPDSYNVDQEGLIKALEYYDGSSYVEGPEPRVKVWGNDGWEVVLVVSRPHMSTRTVLLMRISNDMDMGEYSSCNYVFCTIHSYGEEDMSIQMTSLMATSNYVSDEDEFGYMRILVAMRKKKMKIGRRSTRSYVTEMAIDHHFEKEATRR